jgi:hypothetical protein
VWVWESLKFIGTLLTWPVRTPAWLLGLLVAISLGGLYLTAKAVWPGALKPAYREDIFMGVLWRWDYEGDRVVRLSEYCVNCDTALLHLEMPIHSRGAYSEVRYETLFYCDHCEERFEMVKGTYQEIEGRVLRQIDRKLRNNEPPALKPKPGETKKGDST